MKKGIKRKIILITVLVLLIVVTGCKKGDKPIESQGMTIDAFQHEVSLRASKSLANEYEIDISKAKLKEFEELTMSREEMPQDVFDLINHPKVLEIVLGEDAYLESMLPSYVENQLVDKMEDNPDIKIGEEDLDVQLELLEDYLDALGIQEDSRREYVRELVDGQSANLELELIITKRYAEEIARILEKEDPNFIEELPFDFEKLMEPKVNQESKANEE